MCDHLMLYLPYQVQHKIPKKVYTTQDGQSQKFQLYRALLRATDDGRYISAGRFSGSEPQTTTKNNNRHKINIYTRPGRWLPNFLPQLKMPGKIFIDFP